MRDERRHASERGLLVRDSAKLPARLRVRDRRCDHFGEGDQTCLGLGGQSVFAPGHEDHRAPQPTLDADRRADRRPPPRFTPLSRSRIRVIGGVFDPCRTAGLEYARDRVLAAEWNRQTDPRVVAGAAPASHDRGSSVPVVPQHAGAFNREEAADLRSNRGEHLSRRRLACDQRRHAPQRGLIIRGAAQLLACLRFRDRTRGELGECRQDVPRSGRAVPLRETSPPEPNPRCDRRRESARQRPTEPVSARDARCSARVVRVVPVDPRRLSRLEHERGHVVAAESSPGAGDGFARLFQEPTEFTAPSISYRFTPAASASNRCPTSSATAANAASGAAHERRVSPRAGARPARPRLGEAPRAPRRSRLQWRPAR